MERIVERPGALDVHKESVMACVRVWDGRELEEQMAEFAMRPRVDRNDRAFWIVAGEHVLTQ